MAETTVTIDGVDFKVDSRHVAIVSHEQEFCIRDDVHVTVNIYDENGTIKMTSWLNGVEELNTKQVNDDIETMSDEEIISLMEEFVHENESYILDVAGWDGN